MEGKRYINFSAQENKITGQISYTGMQNVCFISCIYQLNKMIQDIKKIYLNYYVQFTQFRFCKN